MVNFGANYHEIAMKYGKIATEKDIREALAVAYANAEAAFEESDDPIKNLQQKKSRILIKHRRKNGMKLRT